MHVHEMVAKSCMVREMTTNNRQLWSVHSPPVVTKYLENDLIYPLHLTVLEYSGLAKRNREEIPKIIKGEASEEPEGGA